jgi:succinyl-diaminopimelate desuccinylase
MTSTGIPSTDFTDHPSDEIGARLAARTLELIDIPSESGSERDIAEHVLHILREGGVPVRDAGDSCILAGAGAAARTDRPFVLLVGHLDTVPAQGNRPGRQTAEHVEGLGASDMKGGVAVMLELALAKGPSAALDVGYLLFGREELPAAQGALGPLLAREPGLRGADLAIVLEPTAGTIEAGCLGNIDATWTFHGQAGHSARPWLADNAIDRAVAAIQALHRIGPSRRTVDGLDFTQVVSVTTLHAGVARNVIPGVATANVNFRYSPDMTAAQAERMLHGWCDPHGELELRCNSPGARPPHDNPLVDHLVAASGGSVRAKQAWTPVAELAAAGVQAVNLGPGDPALAHRPDERVATAALVHTHQLLESFLCA